MAGMHKILPNVTICNHYQNITTCWLTFGTDMYSSCYSVIVKTVHALFSENADSAQMKVEYGVLSGRFL